MEFLRETGPLIVGALFITVLSRALAKGSSTIRPFVTVVLSLVIGLTWSTLVGEQSSPGLGDRLIAWVVDTSLAFTGATLASWVVWPRLPRANTKTNQHQR